MATRVNRAVELLAMDQPAYWDGAESGFVLTYEQGKKDAGTWADFLNLGMEQGTFNLAGLAAYMRGLADGGPTESGHRTPAVIIGAPVGGTDEANVRYNAWQFRQLLACGIHGIALNRVESAGAVRAFVESCRYPHHLEGVDPSLPTPLERMRGHTRQGAGSGSSVANEGERPFLGAGTRLQGSEFTAAPIWGLPRPDYVERCDPWPLNPKGELLLCAKIESPEGIARCEEILAVPGIGFAELGLGDLGLCLGYPKISRIALPPELVEARDKFVATCKKSGVLYTDYVAAEDVGSRIEGGLRIISQSVSAPLGSREATARAGREYSRQKK